MRDAPATTSHIGYYRAGLTSPEHRRFITVGRDQLLEEVMEGLRKNAGRSTKHHALFIGLRGMGKTHLLSLIEDEIAADPNLTEHYLVVRFPEESLRTLSFADFLLGMVEVLASVRPEETEWKEHLQRLQGEEDDRKVVDTLVPAIRRANQVHQRTLLIMLENMGEVFTRQIKDKREIAALRKFLMESKNGCLLIGTATMSFNGLTSVDEPFYDFFDVQHLEHLSEQESTKLVRRTLEWAKRDDLLAQWNELYSRLIALYRMTGGNPRLTVMLADLIARDSVIEVRDQFRKLLDRITPFYQDRLGALAPQERALLETMATMRDQKKTPASIAKQMRKKVTHTSTLLKRLTGLRLVASCPDPDDKRVRLYTISEGFFDLWLYMNNSRGARERLPFLLDFFASFYPSYLEREKKRTQLIQGCEKAETQANALMALDTLSEVGAPYERARSKIFLAAVYARNGNNDDAAEVLREAIAEPLDRIGSWIARSAASKPYPDYLTEIQELITLWDEHRTGNLEGFVRRMGELGAGFTAHEYSRVKLEFLEAHLDELPARKDRLWLRVKIGALHRDLAHWDLAEAQLRTALSECEAQQDQSLLSWALNELAVLLQAINQPVEAEYLMRRTLEIEVAKLGPHHPLVATKLNNLAQLLQDTNRLKEAEELMRRALQITEESMGLQHPKRAVRLHNLASLLSETNRFAEAEPLMRQALEIDEVNLGPQHPTVAAHLNNLASLLIETNRSSEAEPLIRRALEIDEVNFGPQHPNVGVRLNNLAQLLQQTNRLDEAEPLMWRSLQIDEACYGPQHPHVAVRIGNLASLLYKTNRLTDAEPLMRRALQIDESSFGPQHPEVAIDLNNLAQLLQDTGRQEEAESLMRRALEIDKASFGPRHPKVATRLNNLAQLLQDANRLAESEPLMRRAVEILFQFSCSTGNKHPNLSEFSKNYVLMLSAMGHTPEQAQRTIQKLRSSISS